MNRNLVMPIAALALALIACAMPGDSQPPTATMPGPPALPTVSEADLIATENTIVPTAAPTSEGIAEAATPEGGYPYLDPCTLVTAEEATATLGGAVQGDEMGFDRQFGGCQYHTDGFAQQLYVGAAYGGEAKGMILLGIGMLAQLTDDQAIDDFYSGLLARTSTSSLIDIFTEATQNMPPDPTGENVPPQPVTGIGDAAYYYWYPDDTKAELTFVSGEKFALLRIEGMPEESARPALESLAQTALSRMPEGFHTLNPPE